MSETTVFFFDIDNCLYSKEKKIDILMSERIQAYFEEHLKLDDESTARLRERYYKNYGLELEGLVRFNHVDALEYNREVDDALPLEDILSPDPLLREMLLSIDRTKVGKLWLFTNAFVNHAQRVVKLLGVEDLFDGLTYCDYTNVPLLCKPKEAMFEKAMRDAGVSNKNNIYYVDDSYKNVAAATKFGWKNTVQYVDPHDTLPEPQGGAYVVRDLCELPTIFPEIFLKKNQEQVVA